MTVDETKREPPQWLDAEFLTKALREGLDLPALEITACRIKPATAIGDNYASLMFRAVLEIIKTPNESPEQLSIVCKTLPRGEKVQEMMGKTFTKEAKMFSVVLPAINKLLMDALPDQEPISAENIWYGTDPEPVLILQDLKEIGFDMADRMNGLNMEVANIVLATIAKLHAASLVLIQREPETLAEFKENLWTDVTNDQLPTMMNSSLENVIAVAEEWNDFPEEYKQKLRSLKGCIVDKMLASLAYDEVSLNVLQHGDCWINNMMFGRENGVINTIRMVDFQICYENSAALDLNYFIFTSPSKEIRVSKINQMLATYYDHFMDCVEKLEVKLPREFSLEDLKNEFKKRAFFGFIALIVVYPITITASEDALDVNDFFDPNADKKGMYRTKTFKNMLTLAMPYFIECGAL